MKHKLFKKGTYVLIKNCIKGFDVIAKVKDSTIVYKPIKHDDYFAIPQESLEVESHVLLVRTNHTIHWNTFGNIYSMVSEKGIDNILVEENKIYVSIYDLDVPKDEYKELYYKLSKS